MQEECGRWKQEQQQQQQQHRDGVLLQAWTDCMWMVMASFRNQRQRDLGKCGRWVHGEVGEMRLERRKEKKKKTCEREVVRAGLARLKRARKRG